MRYNAESSLKRKTISRENLVKMKVVPILWISTVSKCSRIFHDLYCIVILCIKPPPNAHCLKITQNDAFEFLNFGIFKFFFKVSFKRTQKCDRRKEDRQVDFQVLEINVLESIFGV